MASLPACDEFGLLPPGIHNATMAEIEDRFGRFQQTTRRRDLFRKLNEYVCEIQAVDWSVDLVINGSFVMTNVDEPNDIDVILILPEDWDFTAEVKPFEYNLLARRRIQRRYELDLFGVPRNSETEKNMVDFFSQVRSEWCDRLQIPYSQEKGLIRIEL